MSGQGNKLFQTSLRPPPLPSNVILNIPTVRRSPPSKPTEDKENVSDNQLENNKTGESVEKDGSSFLKVTPSLPTTTTTATAVVGTDENKVNIPNKSNKELATEPVVHSPSDEMSKKDNFGIFDASINRSNLPMVLSTGSDVEITQTMKLLIVGNAKCGKSSIIARYAMNSFQESYKTTIGADFVRKDLTLKMKDGEVIGVRLQLWDIAGQDRFQKMTRAYFAKAKGVVIVCDVSREGTVEAIKNWKSEIDNCAQVNGAPDIPVILFANKADLLSNAQDAFKTGATMERSNIHNSSYFMRCL